MPQPEFNFEWDPQKAAANAHKHGVSFERAASVFQDQEALTLFDRGHSQDEERWITLGLDSHGSLLVVCHTWREEDVPSARCRIISARKATTSEIRQYRRK